MLQIKQVPFKVEIDEARKQHLAGNHRNALSIAKKVLTKNSSNIDALEIVSLVEMEHGDLNRSVQLLRKIAKRQPERAEAQYNLALAYKFSGRLQLAVDGFRLALRLNPNLKRARNELATTLANLGKFDELQLVCEEILRRYPGDTLAYSLLAFNKPEALGAGGIDELKRLSKATDLSRQARTSLKFSLAELLRLSADHQAAFETLKQANDLSLEALEMPVANNNTIAPSAEKIQRRPLLQATAQHKMLCDFVIENFTPEFLAEFAGFGHPSKLPVFVVGMPRSGSTLVEQILASHPQVFGAGEIGDLSLLTTMKWPFGGAPTSDGRRPPFPPEPKEIWFRNLASAYLARMRELDSAASMVVNKMLGNYVFVGMIHLCFPNATIIDVRRDPVDNCMACYQRQFRTGHEFTYDLSALGAQYKRYIGVMDHWDRVLPGRVIRIGYENLVREPEAQIKRLLEQCGLPWHNDVLRFHENNRPVRTASLSQVRRPISTASVAKWIPYAAHLGPLFDALGLENPHLTHGSNTGNDAKVSQCAAKMTRSI